MNLSRACAHTLNQLTELVNQIEETDFVKPSAALGNSSIGQHLRHTLEFFICFESGFKSGLINYDKRSHDKLIESDKFLALSTINRIFDFVSSLKERSLKLEVGYDLHLENYVIIDTTATRELVYNIEHAVHHMAIMKIGVREVASYITLPSDFGIAASTIRHKEKTLAEHH